MTTLTLFYIGLYYFAAIVLIAGVAYRITEYSRTPAPLKIPTTPAPITNSGVALRMAREVVLFESLFKSNKWICFRLDVSHRPGPGSVAPCALFPGTDVVRG